MLYYHPEKVQTHVKGKDISKKNWYKSHFNVRSIKFHLLRLTLCNVKLQKIYHFYPEIIDPDEVFEQKKTYNDIIASNSYNFSDEDLEYSKLCKEEITPEIEINRNFYYVKQNSEKKILLHSNSGELVDIESKKNIRNPKQRIMMHNIGRPALLKSQKPPKADYYYNIMGTRRGHRHFFHFFANYLQELWQFLHYEYNPNKKLIIFHRPDLASYQKIYFDYIAEIFPNILFFCPQENSKIVSNKFVLSTRYVAGRIGDYFEDEYISFLNQAIANFTHKDSDNKSVAYNNTKLELPSKIYITRKDMDSRQILNNNDIIPYLKSQGFRIVCPTDYSYHEQIRLFQNADMIVATHGAALTNLIFAKAGSHIIEIAPRDYMEVTYMWLAKQRKCHYDAVLGSVSDNKQNFSLDINLLKSAITNALPT